MQEEIQGVGNGIVEFYNNFINFFPPSVGSFINFLILVLLVVLYAIVVWHGYRFISKKDPLELNLGKYNKATNPLSERIIAGTLYLLEYIVIIPFVIFLVLGIFTLFLIFLSSNQNTEQILIISAIVIAAIRMISYYKENLAQEIAKILPLMMLVAFVLNPIFLAESAYFAKVITQLMQIPNFIRHIATYFLFIITLEIILRVFDLTFSLLGIGETTAELKEGTSEEETN